MATDFFERQQKARRRTALLVVYFALAVIGTVIAVYFAVMLVLLIGGAEFAMHGHGPGTTPWWWNPKVLFWTSLATTVVVAVSSLAKRAELAQGGSAVATMLGGRLVNPDTKDPDERRLLNVVEEMAIASGTPVPPVYLLPDESINAFAAGYTRSDAVIGVTQGSLCLLTRDELQGVIAHEFSHILNGDIRLNIRLICLVFGILGIATVGRAMLRARVRGRGAGSVKLLGLLLFLIGSVGVFFGRLIQSAISRQREFLADAAAVQFTRNPAGLAGALKKIGGLSCGSRIDSPHTSETCHMFFANVFARSWFATHPPLAQRIRMLEPHWDGKFVKTARPAPSGARGITPVFKPATEPAAPGPRRPGTTPPARARIQPESFLPALGNPTVDHIKYAAEWRASLPPTIEEAVRSPLGASAVIYALLLSPNEPVRNLQLEQLRKVAPQEAFAETVRLHAHVEKAARNGKLPIVDFALAGLRGLSPRQFIEFKQAIKTLIEADDEIDLFEFVLQKIVIRHLEPHFTSARRRPIQFYSIKPLLPDCAVLLSALAHLGHPDVAAARAAFELGWPHLRVNTPGFELLPHSECTLDKIDSALNRLSEAVPHIKKLLLDAAAHTVSADGMINDNEAELLRAIADALDCPVPPFIQGVQPSA